MSIVSPGAPSFLEDLHQRGMVRDVSDEQGLYAHLSSGSARGYIGFDPTSDSLTVGNLLPIMMLRFFQRSGHQPVVLCGGGTGLVGDPSGKSLERPLLSVSEVETNVARQQSIFEKFLDFDGASKAVILNNLEWLGSLGYLEALRESGRHLSVFSMFQKDSVQSRQGTSGMSYAEFSYQFLQAYDFAYMHAHHGVTLQMGGSDQWGNITTGLELIRKQARGSRPAYGLTAPLLLDKSGAKMGKSAMGAVWMSPDKTSPYDLYQYYLNLDDDLSLEILPRIDEGPIAEVRELIAAATANPSLRLAQRRLAERVVTALYGQTVRVACAQAAELMFKESVEELTSDQLELVFANAPRVDVPRADLIREGLPIADLLLRCSLAQSKAEARRLVQGGGVSVNGRLVNETYHAKEDALLAGEYLLVRRGAKSWCVVRKGA